MKFIHFLFAILVFMAPLAGICNSEEDLRTSDAIRKLKEYKDENLELSSVTAKDNQVRVEGYAIGIHPITDFRNMISKRIGYSQVIEVLPTEKNGRHVSHFVIELEPYFRAVAQLKDATPFVKVYSTGDEAWYGGLEFSPFGNSIRGVPLSQMDSNWCAANEFEKSLFPPSTYKGQDGLDEILKDDRSFTITDKFDGAHRLTVLVGVYKSCNGQIGTFLLALNKKNLSNPVVFLYQFEKPSFAYLEHNNTHDTSTFVIWDCFACDTGAAYKWDSSSKTFALKKSEEEE